MSTKPMAQEKPNWLYQLYLNLNHLNRSDPHKVFKWVGSLNFGIDICYQRAKNKLYGDQN